MPNGKLNLVYFIPDGKANTDPNKQKYKMIVESYDCCENLLILKTFQGVLKKIVDVMGGEKEFKTHIDRI